MLTFDFLSRSGREGVCISVESETLSTSKIEKNSRAVASGRAPGALCRNRRHCRLPIDQRRHRPPPFLAGVLAFVNLFATLLLIAGKRLLLPAVCVSELSGKKGRLAPAPNPHHRQFGRGSLQITCSVAG